jgi:hypothetical protein
MWQNLFNLFWEELDVLDILKILKILLNHPGKLLLLHWCNPQDIGWKETEVLRDGAAIYCHTTI